MLCNSRYCNFSTDQGYCLRIRLSSIISIHFYFHISSVNDLNDMQYVQSAKTELFENEHKTEKKEKKYDPCGEFYIGAITNPRDVSHLTLNEPTPVLFCTLNFNLPDIVLFILNLNLFASQVDVVCLFTACGWLNKLLSWNLEPSLIMLVWIFSVQFGSAQ